uniref:centriolar coiled-coil protein of 110 kDa n=1 Tax=Semicossyphus pulcher TaxID=241346 RepID=UPI0037E82E46
MEEYDQFVQHQLSHLRTREEEANTPSPASSLIRFYGRPVLPPLLSGEQREEMQRHRDAAQRAAVHRKLKDDPRMTYVQTILHSVQLRKTPTLEELLQESEINTQSSYSYNTRGGGSVSHKNCFIGTNTDLLISPPPEMKEKDNVSLPPFTSTTYSAFFASNVTPQQEGCLMDQHYSQHGSQQCRLNGASHQSSGYVTYENVENTTSVSGGVDEGRESHGFGPSEEAYSLGGFFLHNTSNTIAKMPDIISYPPIDGEELERSGLESSFCNNYEVVKDICCSSLQGDSVICENLPGETFESSQDDSTEGEANVSVTTILDLDNDHTLDRMEDQVSLSENSSFSEHLESSQTLSPHHCPITELHIQHDPTETESADNHEDEEMPSEEPYRFSLQALLKKSQEYRRRQRMLRNHAKNSKIQERTQEQPRARAEEPSLSDKENDEFPHKGSVTAEGKKTKERKGTFQSELFGEKKNFKSESTRLAGDENMKDISSVEEETFKNNKLNISPEILTAPKQTRAFTQQQPMSTETSPAQGAFVLTTSPTGCHTRSGKYHSIPAPNFCRSPVHCKSKVSIQDGEAVDGAETSKVLADNGLNEDNLGHKDSRTEVPSTVNLMAEVNLEGVTTRSSQHIDQLESNLSGLKVLISDLESTLTKNFRHQSQTEIKLTQSDDDDSNDAKQDQREPLRRQSLDNFQNVHEDTGPAPCVSDADDVPVMVEEKGTEAVHLSELRLVKTLVTERGKDEGSRTDRLTKSNIQHGGSRKQQPPAKCILSVAQHLRIPDMFRNISSEATAPRDASVLSDTSNHPVERRNEAAADGHNSSCSPSLNQSYDVEAPSGLWLLDGCWSALGTRGHLVQEKPLTPESEGDSHGGVPKVKRRLLMHMTEETRERNADASRGESSVVRSNSSTPKAAVQWNGDNDSHKDKQEQLKLAHAAQVRALQDEHRRQQEELLQTLAVRFRLLQSVSFPCSMSGSRLGDTLTFTSLSQPSHQSLSPLPPLPQPSSPLSERCRPLLLAAVKGFLTRRLLRTERVAQLVRTIRDTQQLLQALLQQQSPGRGELYSRQDLLLQERVTLQLRAARYEVSDIFFSLSADERMQLISWDRELARERELRRQSGHTGRPRGKSSLSAATQKSLQRKRGMMIQKRAAGRPRGAVTRTGHNAGSSAEQPQETKRELRANPQRVPKSTYSSRPR